MDLQLLDFVSFFGYFFFLSFIGWYVGRSKKQAASDYFLAGKTLPWYVEGVPILQPISVPNIF